MFESPTKFLKTLDSRDFDELISIKDDLNYLIDELEHEIRELRISEPNTTFLLRSLT